MNRNYWQIQNEAGGVLPGWGVCERSGGNLCQQVCGLLARFLIGITEQDGKERAVCPRCGDTYQKQGQIVAPEGERGIR